MFDSSLAFEFSVLKPLVEPLLKDLPQEKFPEVAEILQGFARIEPMAEDCVAATSLAREFIGGSAYDYR